VPLRLEGMPAPERITVPHDDYHAEHVGRTADGRQFFLTTPFEPGGNEYVAVFLWDAGGEFLEAKVDNFGPRETLDDAARRAARDARLLELGDVSYGEIVVAPFSVERFGSQIGLVPRPPEDEGDVWAVELLPGNYMAFFEPWDSGDYDT